MKRLTSSLLLSFTLLVGHASALADSTVATRHVTGQAAGFYEITEDLAALYHGRILPNLDDSRIKILSEKNIGRPLAFAIDDKIFTTATVPTTITEGRVQLSGNQTRQQLITLLNAL